MKVITQLSELSEEEYPEIHMELMAVLSRDDFADYNINTDDFQTLLGGDLYIVEHYADMAMVEGGAPEGGMLSIMAGVPIFELARLLPSERWVQLFAVITDAGGPSYYVPKHIADMVPNVHSAMEVCNEGRPLVWSQRGQLYKYARVSPISCLLTERMVPLSPEEYAQYQRGEQYFDERITEAEETFIGTGVTEDDVATAGELYA